MRQDVVQHPVKHQQCCSCFLFSGARRQLKRQPLLGGQAVHHPFLTFLQYLRQRCFHWDLCSCWFEEVPRCCGCMLRKDFPSCVCPSQWCVAGRCRRSKFDSFIFSGRFFLRGAFMLCNVWDVLAMLQHRDYKFYLRRGGGLVDTQTHITSRHIFSNTQEHRS